MTTNKEIFKYVVTLYHIMFVEKRESDNGIKFYLVHSYRDIHNKVRKIRKFLGSNLTKEELKKAQIDAENIILSKLEDMKIEIFDFSLSDKEINALNRYDGKLDITHFDKRDWQVFIEEFVYNTNAIEGSTVQFDEVSDILNKKRVEDPEEIETKGVARAIQFIRETKQDLSLDIILRIHKLCFDGSKDFAGKLRNVEVVIRNREGKVIHAGTPVKKLNRELKEFVDWYNKNKSYFKPLVLAAIVHNEFEDIHPFQDGNGRVGRLLLNFILLKHNYPPINILLEDRAEYYYILQKYQKENELLPTLKFFIKQYKKTLRRVTTKNNNF